MKSNLICFTNSFPYDDQYTEIPFLQDEVNILVEYYNLLITPVRDEGKKVTLGNEIKINNTLALYLRKARKKSILNQFIKSFKYKDFLINFFKCKSLHHILSLIRDTNDILAFYNWANKNIILFQIENLIAYTYWNTAITSGLIYFKKKKKLNIKVISRAHGVDLYIERRGYIPYYENRIKYIDKLFLVSNAGKEYLNNKYPKLKNKFITSYLGTTNNISQLQVKKEDIINIVSCSGINNIKRVDLIYKSILLIAKRNNNIKFSWTHIGGGHLEKELRDLISQNYTFNLNVNITGVISSNEVHEIYKNKFFDCFIHASISEGIPYSFMEAQSYGIPIITTNVGGISEIVNSKNGVLLEPLANENDFAVAVEKIIYNSELRQKLSENDFKNWNEKFKAENNYSKFAISIKNLLNE